MTKCCHMKPEDEGSKLDVSNGKKNALKILQKAGTGWICPQYEWEIHLRRARPEHFARRRAFRLGAGWFGAVRAAAAARAPCSS